VPVVITASLMELHFALTGDGASYATVLHRPRRSRRAARRARSGAHPWRESRPECPGSR
jgi:hypothetical protein